MGPRIDSDKENKSRGVKVSGATEKAKFRFPRETLTGWTPVEACCGFTCMWESVKLSFSLLQWTEPSTVLLVRYSSRNVLLSRAVRAARPRSPVATASRLSVSTQYPNPFFLFILCMMFFFFWEIAFFLFNTNSKVSTKKSVSSVFQFKARKELSIIK